MSDLKAVALANMESSLMAGLSNKGDERKQRAALDAIKLNAYRAGQPVLEWLVERLGGQAGQVLPTVKSTFECQVCGRSFGSHHALCGHQKSHK